MRLKRRKNQRNRNLKKKLKKRTLRKKKRKKTTPKKRKKRRKTRSRTNPKIRVKRFRELEVDDASGDEDTAISLDINVDTIDDVTSVVVSGVPSGASLSAGTDNGDGTWTLSADDLSGLTVTPPADSNVDFQLDITVQAAGGTYEGTLDVDVTGVADQPTLSASISEGTVTTRATADSDFVDDGSTNHTGTDGGDTFVVGRDLADNENFQMGAGDDEVTVTGDTAQGNNFNLGDGNDNLTLSGDILGNTNVNGGDGNDVLYLGKASDVLSAAELYR